MSLRDLSGSDVMAVCGPGSTGDLLDVPGSLQVCPPAPGDLVRWSVESPFRRYRERSRMHVLDVTTFPSGRPCILICAHRGTLPSGREQMGVAPGHLDVVVSGKGR